MWYTGTNCNPNGKIVINFMRVMNLVLHQNVFIFTNSNEIIGYTLLPILQQVLFLITSSPRDEAFCLKKYKES